MDIWDLTLRIYCRISGSCRSGYLAPDITGYLTPAAPDIAGYLAPVAPYIAGYLAPASGYFRIYGTCR